MSSREHHHLSVKIVIDLQVVVKKYRRKSETDTNNGSPANSQSHSL